MTTNTKPYQVIILILLVLLPAFFPYGSREYYLIPYDTKDPTGLITLNALVFTLVSLPYWYFVGNLFSRWMKNFRLAFLLGNLPIFMNAIGETIYFVILGMKQNSYPVLEYIIGSHIDKFNPLSIFGLNWPFISILLSTACLLVAFCTRDYLKKE